MISFAQSASLQYNGVRWRIHHCANNHLQKVDMPFSSSSHTFVGKWITSADFADLPIHNVFHRQLDTKLKANPHIGVRNRHILFRRKFNVEIVEQTIIHITADDYYKLYINGEFITQGPAPAYPFRYYYNSIDITRVLHPGENTIAIHTYYQGLINRVWVSGDNRHGLLLDLTTNDGHCLLASDTSFRCHPHSAYSAEGVTGYQTQFLECYDTRSVECDFFKPNYDDSGWSQAALRQNPDWIPVPQPSKQLYFERISPLSVQYNQGRILVDFGAIYVGYLFLSATGPSGAQITLRFGQELNTDGTVRSEMRCNCNYVEHMILSGKTACLNQFDYKSFRYVELLLPPDTTIDANRLHLISRHYPFHLKAIPKYNDPEAIAVWQLCVDTLHYGVQEVIQDCMDREKGYYMGDGCYTLLTYCILQHDFSLMEKFIDDCLDTAFINPGLMTCADCAFMQEIAEFPLIMITTILPYLIMSGNLAFIRDRYNRIAEILDFYRDQYAESDGLLNHLDKWCVVEWPRTFRDGYDVDIEEGKICTEKHNVINAYFIGAVKALNRIANRLELPSYRNDVQELQNAFCNAFYDETRHLFRDSVHSNHISLPANVFAAFYGLIPDESCRKAVLGLIRKKRLNSALLFIPFPMLAYLLREGEEALVHTMLTDSTKWLNILSEGGTRTFEGWSKKSKSNASLFHLTLSFAAAFLTDWSIKDSFDF